MSDDESTTLAPTGFVPYPATVSLQNFVKDRLRALAVDPPLPNQPRGGTFLGTVKLHGTNITMIFRPDNLVQIQSRNRILSTQSDNANAYSFLYRLPLSRLVNEILRISGLSTYKEIMIAGEFAGRSIQKGVALNGLPLFYAIFNIRIDGCWVGDMRKYASVGLPDHHVFNIAAVGPTFELSIADVEDNDEVRRVSEYATEKTEAVGREDPFAYRVSEIMLGKGKGVKGAGEGIVWVLVSDTTQENLYNFKTKDERFQTASRAPKPPRTGPSTGETKAQEFIDYACPYGGRRMEQGVEYIQEMFGTGPDLRRTREFIAWAVADTMKEEGGELARFEATESDVKKLLSKSAGQWYREQCAKP